LGLIQLKFSPTGGSICHCYAFEIMTKILAAKG